MCAIKRCLAFCALPWIIACFIAQFESSYDTPLTPVELVALNHPMPFSWVLPASKIAVNRIFLLRPQNETNVAKLSAQAMAQVTARHGVQRLRNTDRTRWELNLNGWNMEFRQRRLDKARLGANSAFASNTLDQPKSVDALASKFGQRLNYSVVGMQPMPNRAVVLALGQQEEDDNLRHAIGNHALLGLSNNGST